MTTFETARNSTTTGATEAVGMPRRHVIAIALLMCVPLPLFSVAATVVPLPQIVQRAAATFISMAVPVAGDDGALIREKTAAVRPVEITYQPAERARVAPTMPPNRPASRARAGTAHQSGSKAAVRAAAGGSALGDSGQTSPPSQTTAPPKSDGAPADDQPEPGAGVDPPVSSTPGPVGGHTPSGGVSGEGSSGGGNPGASAGASSGGDRSGGGSSAGGDPGGGSPAGGSGAAGSGGGSSGGGSTGDSSGGGNSGGDSGANPKEPPAHGRDDPPNGGSGKSEPPSSDPGSGPAPQPEPTPPAGGPPDKGHGKP